MIEERINVVVSSATFLPFILKVFLLVSLEFILTFTRKLNGTYKNAENEINKYIHQCSLISSSAQKTESAKPVAIVTGGDYFNKLIVVLGLKHVLLYIKQIIMLFWLVEICRRERRHYNK
jgi:hypothetical protein